MICLGGWAGSCAWCARSNVAAAMTATTPAPSSDPPPPAAGDGPDRPDRADRAVEAGRGALFIGFAKVFFMISGFLQRWLLTRLVGQAEYGAFSLVNNVVSTVNNTMVQGTIQAVSKYTAEADGRADAVKRAGLLLQLGLATAVGLAFLLLAPVIADLAHAPHLVRWFRMVAAIPFLYGFYSVFVGSANGQRRYRTQASFDVGFSVAKTILVLGGAVVGGMLGSSVTGAFVGFIGAALLILIAAARVMGLPRGTDRFSPRRLFVFMGGVVTYTLLVNLALNYDLFLLRRFAGAVVPAERADALAGVYEAMRNIALLPYQALLVVTFVIFPLVSRSTFEADREVTRAYVTQTLRYALILAAALGVVLAAQPAALLAILYQPAYGQGAAALPVLIVGVCCLGLLGIAGSIVNASGRPQVAVGLLGITVSTGAALAFTLVPAASPGPEMLSRAALATSGGMAAGLAAALVYLRARFGAGPPLPTVLRVAAAAAAATVAAQVIPGRGKLVGLAAIAVAGVVFIAVLALLREFGAVDRAKWAKILRR